MFLLDACIFFVALTSLGSGEGDVRGGSGVFGSLEGRFTFDEVRSDLEVLAELDINLFGTYVR